MNPRTTIVPIWLSGLLSNRSGRLLLAAVGVAFTVALIATLGSFVTTSAATMTLRSIQSVPVDWQVQVAPGADPAAVRQAAGLAAPVAMVEQVGYADVAGLSATTGGTSQTTGAGKAIGLSATYQAAFPAEFRLLVGSLDGVLVAQQTAANLHVAVGDTLTIQRVGLSPVDIRVSGVVDLPYADSFFQAVGIPANVAPQAPPDNIVFLPFPQWHTLFDPQAAVRPDTVRTQFHIRLKRILPADPQSAFIVVQQWARNLEAKIAGTGVVGDNLAAQLDGVRSDALYARVLFLFLGLPGALLAMILTLAIAGTGAERRGREQALLRVRGADSGHIVRLALLEGLVTGAGGALLGLVLSWAAILLIAPDPMSINQASLVTFGAALGGGLLLACVATVWPAWRQLRAARVVTAKQVVGRGSTPLWQSLHLDFLLLALAAFMFWRTAGMGYELVLAPEGVAQVSVSYEAFIAPVSLWLGSILLAVRLSSLSLHYGRTWLPALLRALAGNLARIVSVSLGRQSGRLALGIALVSLAVAFAVSTSIFNTTYDSQAQVDAELTNGADVSIRGTSLYPAGNALATFQELPGVAAGEPLQHRFAYVGTDLQDLYGIDASHIGAATHLANAYFASHDARATLALLAAHPDGLLVSEETRNDFQLTPGDHLNLRMLFASDHQYHAVPFTFLGVVREFPTAPKDSFLVANAGYVAKQTGLASAEYVLLKTNGNLQAVATEARKIAMEMPGVQVTDIGTVQKTIGSNLTAISLHGLTALELVFALVLAASASGLILALGFAERKQTFATLWVQGASDRQLGAFVWSEGLIILVGGLIFGSVAGAGLAKLLVLMLTHVFDPPPEGLVVPWGYLASLMGALLGATALAVVGTIVTTRRVGVFVLRGQ